MKTLEKTEVTANETLVGHAPEGMDALWLARLLETAGAPVLHVARDDLRMARLAEMAAFFAPGVEILTFPAWDCLPYDRVGPHRDILAQRIDVLTRLAVASARGGCLVVTTVNALLQRLPPKAAFLDRRLVANPGDRLPTEDLVSFLQANGYLRSDTVREPGDYALRGDIVDLFPPGTEQPLRVDFFGDDLEKVRTFDAMSQLSAGTLPAIDLRPVNEVLLEPASIERFRGGYRALFGARVVGDPLYEAVSAGRPFSGFEHWLPLFYERLETLLDYLPDSPVTFDHQAEEARDARLETIADFYEARRTLAERRDGEESPYRPLPPERLYVTASEWDTALGEHPQRHFTPFAAVTRDGDAVDAGARPGRDFTEVRTAAEVNLFDAVRSEISKLQRSGRRVLIAGTSNGARDRLGGLLAEHGLRDLETASSWDRALALPAGTVALVTLAMERGFLLPEAAIITEQDILGERIVRPAAKRRRPENFLTDATNLHEHDIVVHVDHGIGRYEGLIAVEVGGAPHDCLKVLYAGGDRLFVPVENIEVLSRFGSEEAIVELDRLGGSYWQARRARIKQRILEIARDLIRVAAARAVKIAPAMTPPEGAYEEFAARFPYAETDDQERAITETLADLASGRPMDRLICGDVGFGKTEVALRAAFVAAMNGHQVAVVVPTTLLARQHFLTFSQRFAGLPIRIAQLSRLVSARDAAATKVELAEGKVDIAIGTHALLAKSVKFRDLGLLIVDEEQHFGVKQKERLKELRAEVHVLTLTATPIPRTLQLAMSGVKEMSLIATPPIDRLAVRTFVLPYDPMILREAILREHFRGGQIFYVCPRIEDLPELTGRLRKLVPEVKLAVAHGQMGARALEDVMSAFYERRFDLLLSTNIVESGLDVPTANTMVIHRADMFGLSQLYQLRGRIGRSKLRGYAYLTLPLGRALTAGAERRLNVMQTLDTLGAGFTLASHDLDIRGAGNLLGEEQSGHIREVGIELYQQMLEEAIADARAGRGLAAEGAKTKGYTPQINVGTPVLIPDGYVADLNVRLSLYRRLATLVAQTELETFAAELIDRFGPLPEEVENLLAIMAIKRLCRAAGVEKVDAGPKGAVLAFHKDRVAKPEKLVAFIQAQAGSVNLRPDHKLVYRRQWDRAKDRVSGVRRLLGELAELAL